MMTMLKMVMILMAMMMTQNLNPVKMSMLIMFLSGAGFLLMNQTSGSSWFPNIFFLLFMGGILIMFMILSSIMPNEKSIKMKKSLIISSIVLSISTMTMSGNLMNQMINQMKWMMQSSLSMQMMILMILGYFLGFIMLVSKEKTSMRSSFCYKKNKLVNY